MEQHPVPQNITTFQFRLIGDMTIKQFGYLGGGVALAFISYKLPLPFFFTWPLAAIFALGGFGFAFVPIEERPMDIWFFSFLKNVYSPTVFHWERTTPTPEPSKTVMPPPPKIPTFSLGAFSLPGTKKPPTIQTPSPKISATTTTPSLGNFVGASTQQTTVSPLSAKKSSPSSLDAFFFWIDNLFTTKPHVTPAIITSSQRQQVPVQPPSAAPLPQSFAPQPAPSLRVPIAYTQKTTTPPSVTGQRIISQTPSTSPSAGDTKPTTPSSFERKEDKKTTGELLDMKAQLTMLQKELQNKTLEESRLLELQKQFTELLSQRDTMEKELTKLRTQTQAPKPPSQPLRQAGVVQAKRSEPTVKTMTNDVATRAGLPRLTTFPNVVTGIIKDNENVLLPGVLVTVKDKEGIPLRALKSNKLGQFAASTPLGNGVYIVEVEDPRGRFTFDKVQITLNGVVMPAIQIIAKSKKELDRESLSRQIFGTPNASV